MSQREGPPQSCFSALCLHLVSFFTCTATNEWQNVWTDRTQLHHTRAPRSEGVYRGHTYMSVKAIEPCGQSD